MNLNMTFIPQDIVPLTDRAGRLMDKLGFARYEAKVAVDNSGGGSRFGGSWFAKKEPTSSSPVTPQDDFHYPAPANHVSRM